MAPVNLAALVPRSLGRFLRLGLQQLVDRFLHAAADQFHKLSLDTVFIWLSYFTLFPFRVQFESNHRKLVNPHRYEGYNKNTISDLNPMGSGLKWCFQL